jgi:hypothetical protein
MSTQLLKAAGRFVIGLGKDSIVDIYELYI